VPGHLPFVAQPVQGKQHSVVADGFVPISAGKYEATATAEFAQLLQNRKGLLGQRDDMLAFLMCSKIAR
jgi:hypothetical protein